MHICLEPCTADWTLASDAGFRKHYATHPDALFLHGHAPRRALTEWCALDQVVSPWRKAEWRRCYFLVSSWGFGNLETSLLMVFRLPWAAQPVFHRPFRQHDIHVLAWMRTRVPQSLRTYQRNTGNG